MGQEEECGSRSSKPTSSSVPARQSTTASSSSTATGSKTSRPKKVRLATATTRRWVSRVARLSRGMIDAHIHMVVPRQEPRLRRRAAGHATDLLAAMMLSSRTSQPPALRCERASRRHARSAQPGRASGRLAAREPHFEPNLGVHSDGDAHRRVRELVERGVDVIWRRQANVRFSLGASRRTSQMSSILPSRR
jgi:hypothetical protein